MSGNTSRKRTRSLRILIISTLLLSLQALATACGTRFGIRRDVVVYPFGLRRFINLAKTLRPKFINPS